MEQVLLNRKLVRKTQTWSLVDGAFWTGMVSFGEMLTILYLAKSVTNSSVLAVFSTLPTAIGAVAQFLAPRIFVKVRSRALLMASVIFQLAGLLVVAFALQSAPFAPVTLFVGMVMYWMGGMTAGPPWQDMMAHLIPVNEHNQYFSSRSAILSVVNLATNLFVGLLLQEKLDRQTVFVFVLTAFAFRLVSLGAIWMHPVPRDDYSIAEHPAVRKFSNGKGGETAALSLVGLALFLFCFRFGANLAGPFFNQYMLNHLQFSVMSILVLTSIPLVTRMFLMSNWGAILDRNWVLEGVVICGFGTAVLPLLWTFSGAFGWVVCLQIVSGHVWAGFEVLSVLVVQRMFPNSIMKALAVTLAAGTLGSALGGLAGGSLLDWGLTISQVFRLSTAVRLAAVLGLLFYLRSHGAFRFRSLHIPQSVLQLLSLEPTKNAARSIRTTMSSAVGAKGLTSGR